MAGRLHPYAVTDAAADAESRGAVADVERCFGDSAQRAEHSDADAVPVVADADGVIVMPHADAPRIVKEAESRAAKEREMILALKNGVTTLELMGLTQWRKSDDKK